MKNRIYIWILGALGMILTQTAAAEGSNLKRVDITDQFPVERCLSVGAMQTSCVGADCNP